MRPPTLVNGGDTPLLLQFANVRVVILPWYLSTTSSGVRYSFNLPPFFKLYCFDLVSVKRSSRLSLR